MLELLYLYSILVVRVTLSYARIIKFIVATHAAKTNSVDTLVDITVPVSNDFYFYSGCHI